MFNMGNMGNMMKQAQMMQERMQKAQEEVKNLEATGESGAGLVKVVMNGSHNVKRVEINQELLSEEKEMLEDLLAAAFNDANRRIEEASAEKMSEVTAGIKLPPGMKFPF